MPLKAHLPTFSRELTKISKDAAEAAFKASFLQSLNEGHSITESMDLVARNFGKKFSEEFGDRAAKAIDDHIKSMLLVPKLTSATGGAVSGKIDVT